MRKQKRESYPKTKKELGSLQKTLGVKFNTPNLLIQALIHRSWLNENPDSSFRESNERLEFLGDAVLEFWVTQKLFLLFPKLPEGSLTNIRSAIVRTENLAQKAKKIGLNRHLLLSRGEEKNGGRENPSILADSFEAIIGAIFQDSGWPKTERFLNRLLGNDIKEMGELGDIKDAKTMLQELSQAKFKKTPTYKLINQSGPDHKKVFTSAVVIGNRKIAEGKGRSKQESEEKAAQKALTLLKKRIKITQAIKNGEEKDAKDKTFSAGKKKPKNLSDSSS